MLYKTKFQQAQEPVKQPAPPVDEEVDESSDKDSTTSSVDPTTTAMSSMDKVALDLYAISQGTQKLFGEEGEANTEDGKTGSTEDATAEDSTGKH